MERFRTTNWVTILWSTAMLASFVSTAPAQQTALDRYIAKPDSSYAWKLVASYPGDGVTIDVIRLTSQTWRSAAEVDRPVWQHWLTVVRPAKSQPGTAFLFIGGGDAKDPAPTSAAQKVIALAKESSTVVAELNMVPNQPITFLDSPDEPRVEDNLVAYTRLKFMATGDEEWLVRLAMVKSGVRAMDCISEHCATPAGGSLKVGQFVVSGASKRGWTTWLVAVVDPRVRAIVPLVIDALNSEEITRHHFEAYGFFSSALNDYVRHGLFPHKVGTPEYRAVLAIEDPYNYRSRERLRSIPKYMINAAGDEFFLPDNSQFYFSGLEGEKLLRYVPNAKHNLAGSDAMASLSAFYCDVLENRPRPKFSWKKQPDGSLEVTTVTAPAVVRFWQATNGKARDFRLDSIGATWTSTELEAESPNVYRAKLVAPPTGYTAGFIELTYDDVPGRQQLKLTTEVSIVPQTLPHRWEEALSRPAGESLLEPAKK